MKKIDATINGKDFSDAAKYLEINIDGPIATFILILDNQSGASELLEEYQPVILGYDGNVLLRGYLENVLSDSDPAKPHAVKSKYVKVTGVNAAADLINLMLPQKAKFTDAHIGDIFNVGLLAAESEIVCNPNTDVFPVGTKGPIVKLIETANRYLVDIFEDSCERSSYIYVVNQDEKRLYSFPLSEVPNTGVMLYNLPKEKSNNIIEVNPNARIGDSIYNWVCVRAGNLSDHYTEETAKYLSTNNSSQINWGLSISDDYSVFAVGKASIKGSCNNAIHSWDGGDVIGNYGPQLRFDFPLFNCEKLDYSNISYENCSVYLSHNYTNSIASDKGFFVIIITDNLGRKMRWVTENISKFEWKKIDFVLGYNAPSEGKFAIGHPDRKWVLIDGATSFNWEIVSLAFEFHPNTYTSNPFSCDFWVDGLTFSSSDALEVFAIAEDKQSQQTKRKKMISLYRPDLKSQLAVQYVADAEAQSRTNAFRKYSLMCDIQPSLLYANLLCYVLAPQYHIGSGLNPEICRILSIKHVVFPGEPEGHGFDALSFVEVVRHNGGQNINAARLRRVGNPQNAINTGHENRLVTLENKAGGGSGGSGGGGGAGGSWSGGDVSETINVQCRMPFLNEQNNDVYRWLMTPHGQLQDYSAFIKLSNIAEPGVSVPNLMQHLDLYGVFVSNGTDHNPGLMVGHHLLYRGDFAGRGVMSSLEGVTILHGGLIPAGVPGAGGKVCGWAPSQNPMIWLAQGGNNVNARTLEIRIRPSSGGWGWGNLETANITAHGNIDAAAIIANDFVGTNNLSTRSGSGQITVYNGLAPQFSGAVSLGAPSLRYDYVYSDHIQCGDLTAINGITLQDIYSSTNGQNLFHYEQSGNKITLNGNVTVTGTLTLPSGAANPFDQLLNTFNAVTFTDVTMTGSTTISGNITCHGALDVNWLRADGPYAIGLNSSIVPVGTSDLGSQNNYFQSVWAAMACYKDRYKFNCERNLSGQKVNREIQNEQDALKTLTHEVTKPLYHTTYNLEAGKEDEIICVCGKSVKTPCPEHKTEWLDKYTRNTGKQEEAIAFLTLKHVAHFAELYTKLEQTNDRISLLEQKIEKKSAM